MPKLDEILADAGKTLGVRRIYGEPYEKNGVTIIPAAQIMGGAGGGGATEATMGDSTTATQAGTGAGTAAGTGTGIGFGMTGRPVGAFVIKGDKVSWEPAVDVNRIVLGMQVVLIVFFLVMRSISKTRAKAQIEAAKRRA